MSIHDSLRIAPRRMITAGAALTLLAACILSPEGTRAEQEQVRATGAIYTPRFETRALPDLPAEPGWRDLLQRAFLANGDIEAAFFEWQAAVHHIDIASAWPNTNVELAFEHLFSSDNMKAWDSTTIGAGFDAVPGLTLPMKARQSGRVALDEARAAGERFRAAKFELQRRVLDAFFDAALLAERIAIRSELAELSEAARAGLSSRIQAGASPQELLQLSLELDIADCDLAMKRAELAQNIAALNALAARDPSASVRLTDTTPRVLAVTDAQLLALGAALDPTLAGLAHEAQGRADALELAQLAYFPDIRPFAAFTGSVSQAIGASISVPVNLALLRAQVDEARAQARGSEALARQAQSDRGARMVASLIGLRDSERQARFFGETLAASAESLAASAERQYTLGTSSQREWIDARRVALDIRERAAIARTEREKALAEFESLAGVDIETLAPIEDTPHE